MCKPLCLYQDSINLLHSSSTFSSCLKSCDFPWWLLQAISKGSGDGVAPAESLNSVKVQNADQAVHGKGMSADILKLKQQLREEQAQVRKLEGRLEDANRASEYHRVVRSHYSDFTGHKATLLIESS